jgi:4a-hydroxytetrahydrobiopterin dehydratase
MTNDTFESLVKMNCVACRSDSAKISSEEATVLLNDISEWKLIQVDGIDQLRRVFSFKNYQEAVAFTNRVVVLSEVEDHHPAILLEWGKVTVTWWTHAIGGLHKNDFVMAAKVSLWQK